MDSWVLWNLTGGVMHVCDLTNASRTQLLDIRRIEWSAELPGLFGVPLPALLPLSGMVGTSVAVGLQPAGGPIAAMIGDSLGALYGQAGFVPGTIKATYSKATYSTGPSLMTPTPVPVHSLPSVSIVRRGHSRVVADAGLAPPASGHSKAVSR